MGHGVENHTVGVDMSETTIGTSHHLKKKLIEIKTHPDQNYEDVIWDLINGHIRPYEKK